MLRKFVRADFLPAVDPGAEDTGVVGLVYSHIDGDTKTYGAALSNINDRLNTLTISSVMQSGQPVEEAMANMPYYHDWDLITTYNVYRQRSRCQAWDPTFAGRALRRYFEYMLETGYHAWLPRPQTMGNEEFYQLLSMANLYLYLMVNARILNIPPLDNDWPSFHVHLDAADVARNEKLIQRQLDYLIDRIRKAISTV